MPERAIPFTDVETVDVVGVLKGGGLDLVIAVRGPIDDSPATLRQLEDKIRNYVNGAMSAEFLKQYGQSPGVPIVIYISCAHPIAESALTLIDKMKVIAATHGIGLELRKQMGEVH